MTISNRCVSNPRLSREQVQANRQDEIKCCLKLNSSTILHSLTRKVTVDTSAGAVLTEDTLPPANAKQATIST